MQLARTALNCLYNHPLWIRPFATCGIAHFTRTEILPYSTWISHIRNSVRRRSTQISLIRRLSADVPLGYLISGACPPPFHPDISHLAPPVAGWERMTIQLPRADMSGSFDNAYPECALELSAIPTLISWGLNHQTSRLSLLSA